MDHVDFDGTSDSMAGPHQGNSVATKRSLVMPTLREELEPLRRLVKGGGLPTLKAMIEFIDAAEGAFWNEGHRPESLGVYHRQDCAGCKTIILLDQQIG
jgi:hypothetical protein